MEKTSLLATALRAVATPIARQKFIDRLQQQPLSRGELIEFFNDDGAAVMDFLKHLADGNPDTYDQLLALVEGGREPLERTFPRD
jgi:hypothetical protein